MSNILTARITVEGTRPLVWHAFGPDALSADKKEKTGSAGNDPEEWRRTVLMTAERQLYLKPTYVFGCLRDGAKNTPNKRGTLQGPLASSLQILDAIILVDRFVPEEPIPTDPDCPVFLDICGVRNPATRARNVRYRIAASKGWHVQFNIEWDKTIINRVQMQAICIDAGHLCGLGDGRSIGYGRFIVTDFEVFDSD